MKNNAHAAVYGIYSKLEAERAEKDEEGDGDEKRKVKGGGGGGGLWKNFAIAASMFGFAIGAYKLVQRWG